MSKTPITNLPVKASLKRDLERTAAEEGRSTDAILQDMYNYYMFKQSLRQVQAQAAPVAARLGLKTDEDVYRYLNDKRGA